MSNLRNVQFGANGAAVSNGQPLDRFEEIVGNALMVRAEFFQRFFDPRRDIEKECGYPAITARINPEMFRQLYDREPVAARVVQLYPRECWQVTPEIYEDDDADSDTPFEEAWKALGQQVVPEDSWYKGDEGNPIINYLLRLDELCGIGHFGVLLIGIDDGKRLDEPAEGFDGMDGHPKDVTAVSQGGIAPPAPEASAEGTDLQYDRNTMAASNQPREGRKPFEGAERQLLYLRPFAEDLVQIVQYEADQGNPRFGAPIIYRITLNDPRELHSGVGLPMATVRVHWSRVIHVADNKGNSLIFGAPRMRPVLNRILDLRKLYSSSAEMFWKGGFPGLSMESHPPLGGDVRIDKDQTRSELEQYMNGLQRALISTGMSVKMLAPAVADPSAQIEKQIEAICIQLGCPVRVFKGSERGELASSQDDSAWNDRLRQRMNRFITPEIIRPFVDRLIALRILPEPKQYNVSWPDLDSLTDKDKAGIMFQRAQAYGLYLSSGMEQLIPPVDFMTRFDQMTLHEAEAITQAAEKEMEKQQEEAQQLADEQGYVPQPPEGFQNPPEPPPDEGPPQDQGPPTENEWTPVTNWPKLPKRKKKLKKEAGSNYGNAGLIAEDSTPPGDMSGGVT